eukprot:COSAG06_NODE_20918_length_776_cov_1.400295_1_plen_67_part_10
MRDRAVSVRQRQSSGRRASATDTGIAVAGLAQCGTGKQLLVNQWVVVDGTADEILSIGGIDSMHLVT